MTTAQELLLREAPKLSEAESLLARDVPKREDDAIDYVRAFGQGASLGWADEVEAGFRSWVDRTFSTEADRIAEEFGGERQELDYDFYKGEINEEMAAFQKANPYTSLALELAGGIAMAGAYAGAVGFGGGAAAAAGKQAGLAAVEGAIAGAGVGESLDERLKLAGIGILAGGVLGGAIGGAGGYIAKLSDPKQAPKVRKQITDALKSSDPGVRYSAIRQQMAIKAAGKLKGSEEASKKMNPLAVREGETSLRMQEPKELEAEAARELGLTPTRAARDRYLATGRTQPENMFEADIKTLRDLATDTWKPSQAEMAHINLRNTDTGIQAAKNWFDHGFAPIKRVMSSRIGVKFANQVNRAMNRSLTQLNDYNRNIASVDSVRKFVDNADVDPDAMELKRHMLNHALDRGDTKASLKAAREIIRRRVGEDSLKAYDNYLKENIKIVQRWKKNVDAESKLTYGWLHTQKAPKRTGTSRYFRATSNTLVDDSALQRTRRIFDDPTKYADEIASYENPIRSMDNWVSDHMDFINVTEMLQLRPMGRADLAYPDLTRKKLLSKEKVLEKDSKALSKGEKAGAIGRALKERMRSERFSDEQIDLAEKVMKTLLVDANRSPGGLIQFIRNTGYMGTIMNWYGSPLNLHDVFSASSALGVRNMGKAMFARSGFDQSDIEAVTQTANEVVKGMRNAPRDVQEKLLYGSEELLKKSSKYSFFRGLDGFGKKKVMEMAVRSARDAVKAGDFEEKWQHTFTSQEMRQLKTDLAEGTYSPLVKELAMFRLSQLQPINAAQTAAYALEKPGARIAYMLKNYAVRQFDFVRTQAWDQWKAGNKKEAIRFMLTYSAMSGGGFAVLNQARQPLKGRESDFSPENLASDAGRQLFGIAALGVPGASDFSWEKFWDDPLKAFSEGIIPPTNLIAPFFNYPFDIVQGELTDQPLELLSSFPVAGPTFFKPIIEAGEED